MATEMTTILLNNGLYRVTLDGGMDIVGMFRDRAWHEPDKSALKYHNKNNTWANRYNFTTKYDLWEFVYADKLISMSSGVPKGLYLMYLSRQESERPKSYANRIREYIKHHGYEIHRADVLLIESIVELPADEQPHFKDMMEHRLLHGGKEVQSFRDYT